MSEKISATKVSEDDRMDFMPKHLGIKHLMAGQNLFFVWLEKLSEDYKGGYWEFYELSNGGWYTAPAGEKRYKMSQPGNFYEGEMSADAAGITASLYSLGQLADTTEEDSFINAYHLLRDFAIEHAEGQEILSAID